MARISTLFRALNHLRLVLAVARDNDSLESIADLVESFFGSPQMQASVERFRALPGGAGMMAARLPPLQPPMAELAKMPPGSLGRCYSNWISHLQFKPDFFRTWPIETEEQWLTQRISTTHDIHHVVAGFNATSAGELAVLAINAVQIGLPTSSLLMACGYLRCLLLQPQDFPLLSRAVSPAQSLAFQAAPFCTVRWEEGWERPLAEWRQELGITHPANGEPYGMGTVAL